MIAALFALTIGTSVENITEGGNKWEKDLDVRTGEWHVGEQIVTYVVVNCGPWWCFAQCFYIRPICSASSFFGHQCSSGDKTCPNFLLAPGVQHHQAHLCSFTNVKYAIIEAEVYQGSWKYVNTFWGAANACCNLILCMVTPNQELCLILVISLHKEYKKI